MATHSTVSARFSTRPSTWSNFVVKRFSAVRMPPFGPRLYLQTARAHYLSITADERGGTATHCFITSW